jgi:16S rRNA (guanine1207-N2)-methyltransferase
MAHYFTNENIESNICETKCIVNDIELKLLTDNGVFSKRGLDFGTRTLLESLPHIEGSVLDMGCGYGPIGIYLAKLGANVDMCDINKRALKLAKDNLKLNNVVANVFESDLYANVSSKYDYIISNPPIRVGNEILFKLLFEAKEYLNNLGHLIIVVNKDQGAKTIAKKLESVYKVEIINKNKGFFVIDCQI